MSSHGAPWRIVCVCLIGATAVLGCSLVNVAESPEGDGASGGTGLGPTGGSGGAGAVGAEGGSGATGNQGGSGATGNQGGTGAVGAQGGNTGTGGQTGDTCSTGAQDGDETDVDCGGSCAPCALGRHCGDGTDCTSGYCAVELCLSQPHAVLVTVSSAASTALSNFQVPVDLTAAHFAYGNAQSDGGDLRFSLDGVTSNIPYWIESWNTSGTSRVWVRVPSIPANGSVDLLLLFGDAGLPNASDGVATFEFFDDFDDGTYAGKWAVHGTPGVLTESGGELHFHGGGIWGYVSAQNVSFTDAVSIHADVRYIGTSTGIGFGNTSGDQRYLYYGGSGITGIVNDNNVDDGASLEVDDYPGVPWTTNTTHRVVSTVRLSGSQIEHLRYCNGSNCNATARTLSLTGFTAFAPTVNGWNSGHEIYVALMFVTKYSSSAVTATVH